jgi:hypothetical protein
VCTALPGPSAAVYIRQTALNDSSAVLAVVDPIQTMQRKRSGVRKLSCAVTDKRRKQRAGSEEAAYERDEPRRQAVADRRRARNIARRGSNQTGYRKARDDEIQHLVQSIRAGTLCVQAIGPSEPETSEPETIRPTEPHWYSQLQRTNHQWHNWIPEPCLLQRVEPVLLDTGECLVHDAIYGIIRVPLN